MKKATSALAVAFAWKTVAPELQDLLLQHHNLPVPTTIHYQVLKTAIATRIAEFAPDPRTLCHTTL